MESSLEDGEGRKIVVGMSGGVDSSISLLLLKKKGWKPVGVSLKLAKWEHPENKLGENACCTPKSLRIASEVCEELGVPYHEYDVKEEFREEVMDYFKKELSNNRTPNPCVVCNQKLKFKKLFEWAEEKDIEHVATGHYAKTRPCSQSGGYELVRPKDKDKDQTYGLAMLPQKMIRKIRFPLGDYLKKEVYETAEEEGFEFFLKKQQSQDLCFVSGKAYPIYLENEIGRDPGPIKKEDEEGEVIGEHKGLHFYTIGQRKGLNLDEKYYVKGFDEENNAVIVTKDRLGITSNKIVVEDINYISGSPVEEPTEVRAKVRYSEPLSKGELIPITEEKAEVVFEEPRLFATAGQFCVFYNSENDVCIGGGRIKEE